MICLIVINTLIDVSKTCYNLWLVPCAALRTTFDPKPKAIQYRG